MGLALSRKCASAVSLAHALCTYVCVPRAQCRRQAERRAIYQTRGAV